MAEITPTPRAGTWHEITPNPQWEAQPRAGTWHEIVLEFQRRDIGWKVGFL